MEIDTKEIKEIINVIDWAICSGYNVKKNNEILNILNKLTTEKNIDIDKEYYMERYGICL